MPNNTDENTQTDIDFNRIDMVRFFIIHPFALWMLGMLHMDVAVDVTT